ncbi:unnamed protein product [Gemmata massiliana]|uniref:Uncharacterized protein n=1 Tax=Gemmata massiliana TaxID=1210884 RepID=A0A6P2CV57_9BACT|nr:unnamed protein product [Gemmata massiliana]
MTVSGPGATTMRFHFHVLLPRLHSYCWYHRRAHPGARVNAIIRTIVFALTFGVLVSATSPVAQRQENKVER